MAVCSHQAAIRALVTRLEQEHAATGQLHALGFFGFGFFGFGFGLWFFGFFGFGFGLWFFGFGFFGFGFFGFGFGLWFLGLGLLGLGFSGLEFLNQRDARIRIRQRLRALNAL